MKSSLFIKVEMTILEDVECCYFERIWPLSSRFTKRCYLNCSKLSPSQAVPVLDILPSIINTRPLLLASRYIHLRRFLVISGHTSSLSDAQPLTHHDDDLSFFGIDSLSFRCACAYSYNQIRSYIQNCCWCCWPKKLLFLHHCSSFLVQ